jgi:hypothetical protein
MGGPGSGWRWRTGTYGTTDDYRVIDVRQWHRDGLLLPNSAFIWQWRRDEDVVASIQARTEADRVILNYRHQRGSDDWRSQCYPVILDWTKCNFGGKRPWFCCPARGCGRLVALLYCGGIFACRHCYRLVYPCQRETDADRAARRADRIRLRLDWESGILNGEGGKPKGMHWHSYEILVAEHNAFVGISLAAMAKRFGIKL